MIIGSAEFIKKHPIIFPIELVNISNGGRWRHKNPRAMVINACVVSLQFIIVERHSQWSASDAQTGEGADLLSTRAPMLLADFCQCFG